MIVTNDCLQIIEYIVKKLNAILSMEKRIVYETETDAEEWLYQ
jgi:hypothetical protein